ncbi:hypothetical protein FVB9288_02345 [Flavobacterium sp. CECT 9288]|nr:hypothetical protein FVB9288_02345 [Flavobacterium sp. CECT 9288]
MFINENISKIKDVENIGYRIIMKMKELEEIFLKGTRVQTM